MPVYLVRHAHAGSRSSWTGDDRDRPLSDKGRRQAAGLAERLAGHDIARVVSSPYARCVETVEPVAEQAGVPVEHDPALAEGARPDAVVERLAAGAADGLVACSHGDVIPKVLRLLLAQGLEADAGAVSQKGSVWVLDHDGRRFTHGTYHPPAAPAG